MVSWFSRSRQDVDMAPVYEKIVRQARHPHFYSDWGVPDTVEGRYNMIVLHAFVVIHRLKGDGGPGDAAAQDLFNRMFRDMDQSMREMGVSDPSVGKYMKQLAEGFYGRSVAYEQTLGDREALMAALDRNVYAGAPEAPSQAVLAALAAYLGREVDGLAVLAPESVIEGEFDFGEPGRIAGDEDQHGSPAQSAVPFEGTS